jgi:uracil-DNA glycosylase
MTEQLPDAWQQAVPALAPLVAQISQALETETDMRPRRGLWFEALRRVSPQQVSVVILGQDPYHSEDKGIQQAHGLAFSVPAGVRPPPSLKNILTELADDTGNVSRVTGDLSAWANQGVLLLNASLTTKGGVAGAHRKLWQTFTQTLIQYLGAQPTPLVFILWGADAQKHRASIAAHHVVIESVHPSPLSSYRGFFGSKPFSQCNDALVKLGRPSVDW